MCIQSSKAWPLPLRVSYGRRVGVVGAATPKLDQITSTGKIGILPADPDDMDALAGVIQEAVDTMAAE